MLSTSFPHTSQPGGVCLANSSTPVSYTHLLLGNRRLLCRTALRHRFTAFGIVMGGPQLLIGYLLFHQRVEIPKLTPCPE